MKKKHIVFDNYLPKKNLFVLAMMYLHPLSYLFGASFFIKLYLKHCKNITIVPGFICYYGNIYANNAHLGNGLYMDYAPIYIGNNSSIAHECLILTGHHDHDSHNKIHAKSIHIGKNVLVYARTIITGGVTIGDNSVIGAGSVVVNNIPSNVFAAGNPAKVIKKLPV